MVANTNSDDRTSDRTVPAAIVATVMVLIGLIPAGIVVTVYSFFLRIFIGSVSWISYIDEIALIWFPELLRGMISGFVAMLITGYFFKNFNEQAVRLSALMFWLAIIIAILAVSVSVRGVTVDTLGTVSVIVGLALGLFSDEIV